MKRGTGGLGRAGGAKDGFLVPTHEDGGALTCKYLHQLEASVKNRTPIAGAGINIVRTDAGSTINIAGTLLKLNVCSNGVPEEMLVYGRMSGS